MQEIGPHYSTLGTLLLDHDTGAAIIDKHHHNAREINQEILTLWLQGQGKKPVTWSTLIDVLRDMDLSELAQAIQKALTGSAEFFGETVTMYLLTSAFCQSWYTISSFSLHSPCLCGCVQSSSHYTS